jgi:hypothetical protein
MFTFFNHLNDIFEPNMYLHLHDIGHTMTNLVCVNSNIDTIGVYIFHINQ